MNNKKIKIIYNISSTATSGGGMERVIVLKANTLAEKYGYDVLMITTDQHGKKSFYPYSENIRHIDLGLNYMEIAAKKPFLYSQNTKPKAKTQPVATQPDTTFPTKQVYLRRMWSFTNHSAKIFSTTYYPQYKLL